MKLSTQYLELAITQRDVALATKRPLVAAGCRAQMRLHARAAIAHRRIEKGRK